MSFKNYPHVFQPIKVGNLEIKNRIHFTPLVACASTAEGEVNEEMLEWIRFQAKTGVGYITIGDTQIDIERARCFYGELDVTSDKYSAGLALLAEEAHRFGCKLSIELSHAGRGADPKMNTKPAFAPSDIPLKGCQQNLKVMDKVDMEWVKKRWAECAVRCKESGFDMVMFHSAHNNLMGQFLSPESNKRTDEYGGSLENRMRYPLEVAKALREAVGPDFPLEIRVSAQDAQFGLTAEDTIAYLKEVQKYVNLICVSNGNVFSEDGTKWLCPSYLMPHKLNADYAAAIRAAVDIPVQVVGNVYNIAEAEDILAKGKADIVGICRSFVADPELLIKAAEGREEEIRPCLRCMDGCGLIYHGKQIRCAVNPVIGREARFKDLKPAEKVKKVFVIGGGAAGMEAAMVLAKRGHQAVLFEKGDRLGGILYDAGSLKFKNEIREYTAYLVKETEKCGAEIRLNTECTAEIVKEEKPDAVIVATGSAYIRPNIPGIDNENVHMSKEIDDGTVQTGNRVVICGGGLTGIETAIQLGREGKDVTVVDMIPASDFIKNKFYIIRNSILAEAEKAGVKLVGDSKVTCFNEEGVVIECGGETKVLPADSIVIAFGTRPENKIYDEIYPLMPMSVYKIGDSNKVANIMNAVQSGHDVAYDL